jgi:hypothetical protein
MYVMGNQKLRIVVFILGLLLVLLLGLYHADLGLFDQDYLMKAFVALVFVLIGIVVLDFLVSLSKDIVALVLFSFRRKKRKMLSNETGDSRPFSKDKMDNLLEELEVIINDETLSDETKAKKQLEVFQKYGINPGEEEQRKGVRHEEIDESRVIERLEISRKYETNPGA